jgi:thiamine-monophosphate kinase
MGNRWGNRSTDNLWTLDHIQTFYQALLMMYRPLDQFTGTAGRAGRQLRPVALDLRAVISRKVRARLLCYNRRMKLRDIGEFDLIDRMAPILGSAGAVVGSTTAALSRLTLGIGDDAAVWEEKAGAFSMATTDAMVEGIHFTHATTSWYDLGWKAMASNVSDIAGMGAVPTFALAVLGVHGDKEVEDVLDLCRGMADMGRLFGAAVVGGDTVSSPLTMISITLLGEAVGGRRRDGSLPILSRFAAQPGDVIAVTGRLGSSGGGLELLMRNASEVPERLAPLLAAHRRPMPRVREGQLLVEAGVRCGMDLSDGLAGDLTRICRASKVTAVVDVDSLPLDPLLRETFGARAVDLALTGGEDYELLCTAPPEIVERARLLLDSAGGALTPVGRLIDPGTEPPQLRLTDSTGRSYAPTRSGWEHFTANDK